MGRVLLKVLFSFLLLLLIVCFTASSPGYHSRRQWVSLHPPSPLFFLSFAHVFLLHRVGKTSLMNQYVNKRFSNQYKATIGADLYDAILLPNIPVPFMLSLRQPNEGGHG
jgi:hypothetical protein